jgi:tRNA A37 methylthiotransferase MiaB
LLNEIGKQKLVLKGKSYASDCYYHEGAITAIKDTIQAGGQLNMITLTPDERSLIGSLLTLYDASHTVQVCDCCEHYGPCDFCIAKEAVGQHYSDTLEELRQRIEQPITPPTT